MPVEEFARSAKQLLPNIELADLTLAYSGIRAKLTPPMRKSARISRRPKSGWLRPP